MVTDILFDTEAELLVPAGSVAFPDSLSFSSADVDLFIRPVPIITLT